MPTPGIAGILTWAWASSPRVYLLVPCFVFHLPGDIFMLDALIFSAPQQPLSLPPQFSLLPPSPLYIPAPPFLVLFPCPHLCRAAPPFRLFFSPDLRSRSLVLSLAWVHLCSCVLSDPRYADPRPWVRGPCVRVSFAPHLPASRRPPPPSGTALPYCRGAVHCAGTVNRWTPSWRDKTASASATNPSD